MDGPAFNTRSRTAKQHSSNDPTPQTDATVPVITETGNTTPKSGDIEYPVNSLHIFFQHCMHDCTYQHNMGQQRISIVPACAEGISHMSLLDDHSKCITREYGKQWKLFTRQMIRTHQFLPSLLWKPAAPTQLLSGLDEEFSNLNSIYTSYQPLIQAVTQLLQREPSFDGMPVSSKCMKRSLLPFLGDALSWLTGTATMLISTQQNQQETLVHVILILNVTRYATQVNRQHISILMDAMEKTYQDITSLYNIMHSLYSSMSYHQIILHIRSILANLWDSLHYMPEIALHTMDYINAATTGMLSPDILPVQDLRKMLKYIEDTLPSMMHLPISSENTLNFYRYLHTHILIADEQFLLLIDGAIQDHAQQIEIYEVFNLEIPHKIYSLCYDIDNKYLGITLDETSATKISDNQFNMCKKANGQFCILNAPLLPLSNPPTCLSSLYAKDKNGIQKRCSLQVKKADSISIPKSIAPNVWIIISLPAAAPARIMLICP